MNKPYLCTTFFINQMLTPEEKKEKQFLWKELKSLLDLYREVSTRGVQIKAYYDSRIDEIVERLKEIGS